MIDIFKLERIAEHFAISIEWFVENKGEYGDFNPNTRTINIWSQCSNDEIVQTFFHELCHAIDPVVHKEEKDLTDVDIVRSELLAELVSKEIVGDKYWDDGAIKDLKSCLSSKNIKVIIDAVPEYVDVIWRGVENG